MTSAEARFPTQSAVYRSVLRVLSPAAARSYGDEMTALFCFHLSAARGSWRQWMDVWSKALADMLRHGAALGSSLSAPPGDRPNQRKEPMRERLHNLATALARDTRYALRLLRKDWGFTLTATLILGLGVGANTAVFSFVDTYLLRALPYPDPQLLYMVGQRQGSGTHQPWVDGATWETVKEIRSDGFRAAVYSGGRAQANLVAGSSAMSVAQQRVGAGYFGTLGVPPMLGRDFTEEEDIPDGPAVTILSHHVWQQLFAGDREAIGDSILLRGEPYTVVGVLSPDFASAANADLWTPLRPTLTGEGEGTNYRIVARVSGKDALPAVETTLAAAANKRNEARAENRQVSYGLMSMQETETRDLRQMLVLLWASVGAVLLIACVNVSGLLLARGARRGRELATRMAIGGGRGAIVRQLMIESLVLGLAGGIAGAALARLMLSGLTTAGRGVLDNWRPVALDGRVLLGCALFSLLTALLFGLAPAFQAGRVSIHDALRAGSTRGASGGARRWRRLLVGAEVTLSVVLLVTAGLLLRTFLHLQGLAPGFDPSGIVTVSVSLQDKRYEQQADVERLLESGLERLRALPIVESATAGLGLPFARLLNMGFAPQDFELPEGSRQITNLVYSTSDYFETLGVRVLAGRTIERTDVRDSGAVAVINDTFARIYMPDVDPVGRVIATAGQERLIVGVVETVKQVGSLQNTGPLDDMPTIFLPVSQVSSEFLQIVHTWFAPAWIVRVSGEIGTAIPEIDRALSAVDPLLPLAPPRDAAELQASAIDEERFLAVLVATLAAASIVLAGLGIFGLVSATVAESRRDIGVRLALGATARQAIAVAALPSVRLSILGAIVGIVGSVFAARSVEAFLWGVPSSDPATYIGVAVTLVITAAIASLIPARRAARVDPARTLQAE